MVTSLLSSIFGTSSTIATRIDSMKAAEKSLISFSHRFSWGDLNPKETQIHTHAEQQEERLSHKIELFDTQIPRSVVPLLNGKTQSCQLCCSSSYNNTGDDGEYIDVTNVDSSQNLIIHGVQVTRKHSSYNSNSIDVDTFDDTKTEIEEAPLVLLHGYMNGALYFYRNLIGLADHCSTVYSLDMLGWGLSSRPPFQMDTDHHQYNYKPRCINQHTTNTQSNRVHQHETHAAEQVFVESLEAWRKAHNIPKMKLAGHSMGGYMSVAYAEKYPERVERLILISPAGVPDDEQIDVQARFQNASFMFRTIRGVISGLFNFGITPAGFLRNLPESRGRNLVSRYIQGRLPAVQSTEEQEVLGEYLYMNAALPPSGEDCLNKVLKPTAFAKVPALYRIPSLKVKHISFIYGQNDWMDPSGGIEAMEIVEALKMEEQKKVQDDCMEINNDIDNLDHNDSRYPTIEVYGVKNAGHLLMLENWQEFNAAMIMALGCSKALPMNVPRPYKVLLESTKRSFSSSSDSTDSNRSSLKSSFFVKPRWERKQQSDRSSASFNEDT